MGFTSSGPSFNRCDLHDTLIVRLRKGELHSSAALRRSCRQTTRTWWLERRPSSGAGSDAAGTPEGVESCSKSAFPSAPGSAVEAATRPRPFACSPRRGARVYAERELWEMAVSARCGRALLPDWWRGAWPWAWRRALSPGGHGTHLGRAARAGFPCLDARRVSLVRPGGGTGHGARARRWSAQPRAEPGFRQTS